MSFSGSSHCIQWMLQWGCAFSSAEIMWSSNFARWQNLCFNGAALFQAQKSVRWGVGVTGLTGASMGLRFFKRRNNIKNKKSSENFWSFNGAALFQAQKCKYIQSTPPLYTQLQWGCAFSSAEIPTSYVLRVRLNRGFNGAALFQAQKCTCPILPS